MTISGFRDLEHTAPALNACCARSAMGKWAPSSALRHPQWPGLAYPAGILQRRRRAADRRRSLIRPQTHERPTVVGHEGFDQRDGSSEFPRTCARGAAAEGTAGRLDSTG